MNTNHLHINARFCQIDKRQFVSQVCIPLPIGFTLNETKQAQNKKISISALYNHEKTIIL